MDDCSISKFKASKGFFSMTITINRLGLLEFYDQKHKWPVEVGSPISAITGLIGEDLVLGLLHHYLRTTRGGCNHPIVKCRGKGSWLDAWVITNSECYQTEVKNWCASAFGGREIKADDSNVLGVSKYNLVRYLTHKDAANSVWKVLKPMSRPAEYGHLDLLPLLAFWSPVALPKVKNASQLKPFFKTPTEPYQDSIEMAGVGEHAFRHVWIFSASLYLRQFKQVRIKLQMPRAVQRLKKLQELVDWPI